jgi:hypothetical protein
VLRTGVLVFACALTVWGAFLCLKGAAGFGGVPALVSGVVLLVGTLFERWRYNNRNASAEGNWQVTGERFVDPESGLEVEVLYDPDSGERRYRNVG